MGGPQPVNFSREKNLLPLTGIEPPTIQPTVQSLYQVCYPGSLLVGLKQNMVPIMNTALRVSFSGKIYMRTLTLKHPSNINFILDN
jgi:hypothetical protein